MSKPLSAEPRFVVCVENGEYRASLEVRKRYQVVTDPDAAALGQLRVIDESGEDYLYPLEYFAAVDYQGEMGRAGSRRVSPHDPTGRRESRAEATAGRERDTFGHPTSRRRGSWQTQRGAQLTRA